MTQHLDRRHFLGLAGMTASAAALAACGGPSGCGTPAATEAAEIDFNGVKPAAKIDFWSNHPGKSQDVEKAIIEKFHAKFPDIRVNLVTAGANYEEIAQKFQTSQAAKTGLPGLVGLLTSGGSVTSPTGASSRWTHSSSSWTSNWTISASHLWTTTSTATNNGHFPTCS